MRKMLTMLVLATATTSAWADDLDQLDDLIQSQFRIISEDLTAALGYKAIAPAEPLGITGFDVGVEVTATKLQSASIWETATGEDLSTLPVPKVHIHKGLPMNFDIGAFYTAIPGSNIKLYGGELRYAILEGTVATPALAVRGAMSKMTGVEQLDFDTKSVELAISKGFLMLTPYASIGKVWTNSSPNVSSLQEESYSLNKYAVGANLNLGLMNMSVEADKTGENNSLSAKLGFRW